MSIILELCKDPRLERRLVITKFSALWYLLKLDLG